MLCAARSSLSVALEMHQFVYKMWVHTSCTTAIHMSVVVLVAARNGSSCEHAHAPPRRRVRFARLSRECNNGCSAAALRHLNRSEWFDWEPPRALCGMQRAVSTRIAKTHNDAAVKEPESICRIDLVIEEVVVFVYKETVLWMPLLCLQGERKMCVAWRRSFGTFQPSHQSQRRTRPGQRISNVGRPENSKHHRHGPFNSSAKRSVASA